MTIKNLHAILTRFIAAGHGRKTVCIDKSKVNHVLEDDGAVIIPVTAAVINTHEMCGDDGGLKELANGKVATRTSLVFEAEMGSPAKEERLKCAVVGNRLLISIGIETLAFSAEHCDDNPNVKITDHKTLAEDVRRELSHENEVGETLITSMLDRAVTAAFENGSTAFDHEQPVPIR